MRITERTQGPTRTAWRHGGPGTKALLPRPARLPACGSRCERWARPGPRATLRSGEHTQGGRAMTTLIVPELDRPRTVTAAKYPFEGPQGRISLADLFDGHRRLAVHHTLPGHDGPFADVPDADIAAALHDPDLRLVLVSRAPYAKLERYRRHFGRDLPTYSAGRAFTADFPVSRRLPET